MSTPPRSGRSAPPASTRFLAPNTYHAIAALVAMSTGQPSVVVVDALAAVRASPAQCRRRCPVSDHDGPPGARLLRGGILGRGRRRAVPHGGLRSVVPVRGDLGDAARGRRHGRGPACGCGPFWNSASRPVSPSPLLIATRRWALFAAIIGLCQLMAPGCRAPRRRAAVGEHRGRCGRGVRAVGVRAQGPAVGGGGRHGIDWPASTRPGGAVGELLLLRAPGDTVTAVVVRAVADGGPCGGGVWRRRRAAAVHRIRSRDRRAVRPCYGVRRAPLARDHITLVEQAGTASPRHSGSSGDVADAGAVWLRDVVVDWARARLPRRLGPSTRLV